MKIVLLMGLTASGKSTVGRLLAKYLSFYFVDLDELVAKKERMSVRSFYEKYGKKKFQEIEAKVLKDCLEGEIFGEKALCARLFLISAGGGLIENANACAILRKNTHIQILFLHNKPKILFNRLLKKAKKEHSFPAFLKTSLAKDLNSQIKYARKKFLSICKRRIKLLKNINCVKVKAKGLNVKKIIRMVNKIL